MFINCTNHPYEIWGSKQQEAAGKYGDVVEIRFPAIEPEWDAERLRELVDEYAERIESLNPDAVLVAGEFLFAFMLVDRLLTDGVNVVCSRSRRVTTEVKKEDGTNEKKAIFDFEGFYKYEYYQKERNAR